MLNNQSRKNLVETYKIFGDAKKTAQVFGVTKWTVYRLNKQFEVTGYVELKTSTRGRKSKLTEENLNQISTLILENPDITLQEIKDKLNLDCNISVLCRAIRNRLGFTRKKSLYAAERDKPEVQFVELNGRKGCRISTPTNSSS